MTRSNYVELSERAFRSARVAVVIAGVAPVLPSIGLVVVRAVFGTHLPVAVIAIAATAWCLLWGALFASFLWGLQGHERRVNRVPAIMYATGLWFVSSLVAAMLTAITSNLLAVQ